MAGKITVVIPLPNNDFDTTEVSVPWKILERNGVEVFFATEKGADGPVPQCDPYLLTGVIMGQLGAEPEPKAFYDEMRQYKNYKNPISYDEISVDKFNGILCPGGHAKGMRPYLENQTLQQKVVEFFNRDDKIVAAICHGPLVLARAIDPSTGKSVLFKRKTTCLPFFMERSAYFLTAFRLGDYYRTYDEYCSDEVQRSLENPAQQYNSGPVSFQKGTDQSDEGTLVVEDGNYISGRWPGDAYVLGKRFLELLRQKASQ